MTNHVNNAVIDMIRSAVTDEDLLGVEGKVDELRALWYFMCYIADGKVNSGTCVDGFSLHQDDTWARLVVKANIDGTRRVAFISSQTTTRCVAIFVRQWRDGVVKWYDDKFA